MRLDDLDTGKRQGGVVVAEFELGTIGDVNGRVFTQRQNFQHETVLIYGGAVAAQADFKLARAW